MLKLLKRDLDLSIRFSRYYMAVSMVLFLLLRTSNYPTLLERMGMLLSIGVAYMMFFNIVPFALKKQVESNSNLGKKRIKGLKLNLYFFIGFAFCSMTLFILAGIVTLMSLPTCLLAINIPMALILGSLKGMRYLPE